MRRAFGWVVLVAAAAGVSACESSSSAPTAPSGALQVTLAVPILRAGDSTTASATAAGASLPTPVWTSSDATVATVDAAGAIAARRAGRATITATAGSSVGQASLRVVSNYAGVWTGPLVRAQPSCAPTSTAAVCAAAPPPGTLLAPLTLTLSQAGATVTGTLVDALEPALSVVLSGEVAADDVLTLSGATATSPTSMRQLTVTNLRATFDPTVGSITGSYTMVAATTGAAGPPATDYSFQAQFRDLIRR